MKAIHSAVALFFTSAALAVVLVLPSPAWAVRRCPGLVITNNAAECKVVNYSTTVDTAVLITLYDTGGNVVSSCGPSPINAKGSILWGCAAGALPVDLSCEVTGEGTLARVSLYVKGPTIPNTGAIVECR